MVDDSASYVRANTVSGTLILMLFNDAVTTAINDFSFSR